LIGKVGDTYFMELIDSKAFERVESHAGRQGQLVWKGFRKFSSVREKCSYCG